MTEEGGPIRGSFAWRDWLSRHHCPNKLSCTDAWPACEEGRKLWAELRHGTPTPPSPQFQHDCKACIFLGRFVSPDGVEHDLYSCPKARPLPTLIARYGSEGPSYISGRAFIGIVTAITEAARLEAEAGLAPAEVRE